MSFCQIRVDLSRDGGATWETIIPCTPDDGEQAWKVTGPASSESRIRVVKLGTAAKQRWVKSEGRHKLEKLYVNLESPNGGETFRVGTRQLITWTWISEGHNRDRYDVSDANFTILPSVITVDFPNGGENWKIGTRRTITWTSDGDPGMVKIGLSRDGGKRWETITAYTSNDGKYTWKVTGPATDGAMIAVVSRTDQAVFDISDANFTIVGR